MSLLSGFRAPFHTLRLLVGGREDGRGCGAFGGPGKRGGNKKEPLDLVRWIVRDAGEREGWLGIKAPSPPRLLVGGREDGRGYGAFGGPGKRAEDMVPLVGKRGGNKKETVGSCAVDCQG